MNIERYHESHPYPGPHQGGLTAGGSVQSAGAASNAQAARVSDDGLPSDALGRLVDSLQTVPDVRPEAVAQARAKIAAGELLTRAAAEETASAFLRLS